MSGHAVHQMDRFENDNDWSQGLPTSVSDRSATSIPQTRGTGDCEGTTQNNYVNLFFCMDNVRLNEVFVPKNKQGFYGSKDNLHILEISTAPLDPKFGVISHVIMSCNGKTDWGDQTKH